jgi:predicted secreted protein
MKSFRTAVLILIPAAVLAASPAAWAQTDLTIAATGQVSIPPDEANATLTAQAQDVSAAKAQAEVNTAMAKALALANKEAGVKAVTTGYSTYTVTPDNNAPQKFAVQQTLQLSIKAPAGVPSADFSNLLGTLQQDGLLLNALSGDLSDDGQRQAQQAAIADALTQIQGQAAGIAANLHEQVGAIKSLNVNAASNPGPRPMMAMAAKFDAAPAPQSAPDNVQVTANVTADIELTRVP